MGSANIDNAGLVLVAGSLVTGKVVQEGPNANTPPRGVTVSIAREPDLVGVPSSPGRAPIQMDGTFSLQAVGAGDYRLYVSPLLNPFQWGVAAVPQQLQNLYVKSIRAGSTDVLSDGLVVPAGGSPGELEIVLAPGGRLDGQAVSENHEPMRNVTVALVPDVARRRRPDMYRTTSTDIYGRFHIQGIPPGSYKVFAWEEVEKDIWQNPEFMLAIEGRGAPVDIQVTSQSSVDVQVIPLARR
jgi:hypothetical protein